MAKIANITFACAEPLRLATFWKEALGYELEEVPPDLMEFIQDHGLDPDMAAGIHDPEGRSPRLFFLKMDKCADRPIPIHLDLQAEDREGERDRLVALGASFVEERNLRLGPIQESWYSMRDPEGNGFDLQ